MNTILILFLSFSIYGNDQNKAKIDSLLELSKNNLQSDPNDAYSKAKEAFDLVDSNDQELLCKSMLYMSRALITTERKEEGLQLAQRSLELARQHDYEVFEVLSLNVIGLYYYLSGVFERANEYYHSALEISERIDDKLLTLQQLNQISIALIESKEYDRALEYLDRTKKIAKEENLSSKYVKLAYGNTAYALLYQKKYAEALPPLQKAIELNKDGSDNTNSIVAWDMMAQIMNGLKKYDEAIINAEKAIDLANNLNYIDGKIIGLNTKSKILLNQNKFNQAIVTSKEALTLSNSIKSHRFNKDLYQTIYKGYEELGDYKNALNYHIKILSKEIEDNDLQKIKLTKRLDIEYQVKTREQENEALLEKQKVNEIIINQRTTLSIGAISLMFLLGLLSYLLYNNLSQKKRNNETLTEAVAKRTRELEQANKALKTSNEELERFAFVASHDLKEPVRNLVSFSTLLDRELKSTENKAHKEYLSIITINARNIFSLVDGILNFSRIRNSKLNPTTISLNALIDTIENLIQSTLKDKRVVIDRENLGNVEADYSQLLLVIKNIIENGIKYNENEIPNIKISHQKLEQYDELIIQDNGIGIDPKYHDKIFDMFKRLHNKNQYEGSGMGLAISKKIIQKHNGSLNVRNNDVGGSSFIITLPN